MCSCTPAHSRCGVDLLDRFPGQENAAGNSKIPSIMYYNPDGSVRAVGAEAALPGLALDAEDQNLHFVEWYANLHQDIGTDRD